MRRQGAKAPCLNVGAGVHTRLNNPGRNCSFVFFAE
jgi:hypothetical protein